MMNLMLVSLLGGECSKTVVSKERLDEIFAVPETAQLWEEIISHDNYIGLFHRTAEFISDKSERDPQIAKKSMDESTKNSFVLDAMPICAQEGISFDKAVQKAEEKFLEGLNSKSAEEIDSFYTENEKQLEEQINFVKQIMS